jgi:hypothetical protein
MARCDTGRIIHTENDTLDSQFFEVRDLFQCPPSGEHGHATEFELYGKGVSDAFGTASAIR